jgi:hypothetical protein
MESEMVITFQSYREGRHPNLKFSPGLVLGWLVQAGDTEVRYALSARGRVLRSEQRPISDDFAKPGENWTEVSEIPGGAEFIGNYKPPSTKKEG